MNDEKKIVSHKIIVIKVIFSRPLEIFLLHKISNVEKLNVRIIRTRNTTRHK